MNNYITLKKRNIDTQVTCVTKDSTKKDVGRFGEKLVEFQLEKKGCLVLERNLRLKSGEIDILVCKEGIQYIIEVKTARFFNIPNVFTLSTMSGSGQKGDEGAILPEENLSRTKLRTLSKLRRELIQRQINNELPESLCHMSENVSYETRIMCVVVYVFCSVGGSVWSSANNWRRSVSQVKIKYFLI